MRPAARGSPREARRDGFVLVATILLVATLALAIAAGTYVAAQAASVARAREDALRARLAAEGAARAAAAAWNGAQGRSLRLLTDTPLASPGAPTGGSARLLRLGGDRWLVLADGRAGAARARAGLLLRVLSVRSLLPPFPAALTGGRVALGPQAVVDATPGDPPAPWPAAACDPGALDTLAAVFGDARRPGIATTPGGTVADGGAAVRGVPPVAEGGAAPDTNALGPLPWELVPDWSDRVEAGTVRPAPAVRDGVCDRGAPGNWGAPLDPVSPCAAWFPLIYVPGDLRIAGGAGQGVLLARGKVILEGGARFYGAILSARAVEAAAGVELRGAVRAPSADWHGLATYSPCALLRVLGSAPGLGHPLRAARRLWVPVF